MITAGQIVLKHELPEDMHHMLEKPLDAKGIRNLFATLAEKHPDKYRDVVSKLTTHGFEASSRMGSSVSLEDLRSPIDKDKRFDELQVIVDKIRKGDGTKVKKDGEEATAYMKFMDDMNKEVLDAGLKGNKTLAKIILSGSRGSPTQYRQTVAAPGIVPGPDGKPLLDFPLRKSFAEGLSPTEYLAHSFGTRTGLAGTKLCHSADTEVRMADGTIKQIKDIKVGELVLGADKDANTFPVEVTNVFDNGIQDVNEYFFYSGSSRKPDLSVRATAQHKVLAYTYSFGKVGVASKKELGSALYGKHTKFYAKTANGSEPTNAVSHSYDLLLGLMLGDGCTVGSKSNADKGWIPTPQFSCGDPVMLSDIHGYLASLDLQLNKGSGYSFTLIHKTAYNRITKNGKNYTGQPIKLQFSEWNLWHKHAHEKTIPVECYKWTNYSVARLLAGLWSTDGCFCVSPKGKPTATFQLANEKMVEQVKELMRVRFGIHAGPTKLVPKEQKEHAVRDQYGFSICNHEQIKKIAKYIPLVGVKKTELTEIIQALPASNRHDFRMIYRHSSTLGAQQTYDLEVGHPDHMYVLANGMITSNSVADSGALSKVIFRSSMTIKIEEHDCGTHKGIPISTENKDYIGSFIAVPVGEFKHNNELTSSVLQKLKSEGIKEVIVRSPITCESNKNHHHGAVCQLCVGRRDKAHLLPIGDFVGVTAGTTLGEKMSQMTLGSKHTGSTVKKQSLSGFKLVNQLFNVPETFRDKAPLAEEDGVVESVEKAGQGGFNIKIKHEKKTHEYYVPTGFEPKVKPQQRVEVGDVLSDGLVNPADVVRLQGVGEGRRHAAQQLKAAFDDAGLHVNSRNFDVLTRNAIDHVRITDDEGLGDYLPNQVVSYNNLEKSYHARKDAKQVRVGDAKGMYLEAPALHYTIGTKLSSGMLENLKKHHFDALLVHDKAPGFVPEMQRLVDIPAHEDDWMHQLYSTYLQKRFVDAVNQGMTSDLRGASPIAGLAAGTIGTKRTTNFGEVKKELHTGVKVAATLINGDCELSNASKSAVDVTYANGNQTRRTWDGLSMIFKSAELIEKTAASKGCLMLMLAEHEAEEIAVWAKSNIPEKHLTADGFEKEPHVTLMYGFLPDTDVKELEEFLAEQPLISVTLGDVSRFVCKDDGYDVIKVAVEADSLHELNTAVAKRFGKDISNNYPDYKPHLTLAYVKHGSCKGLDGSKYFKGKPYVFDSVLWSPANSKDRKTFHFNTHKEELMLIDG